MNENPIKSTAVKITELADIFEKTLLELSILDSLYGGSNISDYVQKVFRASVEELHHFGTLKTLCALIDDTAEYQQQKNKQKEDQQCRLKNNEPILCQRLVSNDKLFVLDYISSGEKLQLLKEEEEEIDSIIEKCTVSLFN
jgi:hypothetical protein